MKRHGCFIVGLAIVIVVLPRPAHAGLLSWLDQLSGPGPFLGFDASFGVKCSKQQTKRAQHSTMTGFGVRAGCQSKVSLDEHNLTWFVVGGAGFAKENHLHYGSDSGSKAVRFLKAGTSLDYTVHRALDIGTGAGVLYFNGPSFANFARVYVEPVRVGLRPLVLKKSSRNQLLGAVMLYVNWHILTGTVEGRTFGAPADQFRASHELDRKEWGLVIDVGRLIYWK